MSIPTIDPVEAYTVATMSDLQLINDCWMRDLSYADYVLYVAKFERPVASEDEYLRQGAAMQAQMDAYFASEGA